MAISRKGLQQLVVDKQRYYWLAKGTDYGINLTICAATHEGQKLTANFEFEPLEERMAQQQAEI